MFKEVNRLVLIKYKQTIPEYQELLVLNLIEIIDIMILVVYQIGS